MEQEVNDLNFLHQKVMTSSHYWNLTEHCLYRYWSIALLHLTKVRQQKLTTALS